MSTKPEAAQEHGEEELFALVHHHLARHVQHTTQNQGGMGSRSIPVVLYAASFAACDTHAVGA
jgi:hypothetical protein